MANICSVANCDSTPGVTLHKYPLYDEELFKTWVMRTNNPRLPAPENLRAYKTYFVCGKHFLDDCLMPDGLKLKQFALPTIGCPGYFGEPTVESSYLSSYLKRKNTTKPNDTVVIDVDHCYTGLPQEPIENIPIKTFPPKFEHKKAATSPKRPLKSIDLDSRGDEFQPQDDVPLAKLFKQVIRPTPLSSLKNKNAPVDPLLPLIVINSDKEDLTAKSGNRIINSKVTAITPPSLILMDVLKEDGKPQNVLKSILKPTSLKYLINENLNAITAKKPPVKTLLIDLDKDEFQPEKGVPPGTIFLDLDNDNSLINNKTKYKYSILNTKTSEKVTKNKIEKPQALLDLDIENFIIAKSSNTETALAALSLGDQKAPIYDLTGDDDPLAPTVNKTKEYIKKPGKYYPPRERSVPLETTEKIKKSDRTTPKILLHNKKTIKKTDTLPPPPIETEIPQKPESPPPIIKIDDKKLILERIKAKKLLIKKKRQDAVDSSLTLLKPTAISYVPLNGSYKTTVYVRSLGDNDQHNVIY